MEPRVVRFKQENLKVQQTRPEVKRVSNTASLGVVKVEQKKSPAQKIRPKKSATQVVVAKKSSPKKIAIKKSNPKKIVPKKTNSKTIAKPKKKNLLERAGVDGDAIALSCRNMCDYNVGDRLQCKFNYSIHVSPEDPTTVNYEVVSSDLCEPDSCFASCIGDEVGALFEKYLSTNSNTLTDNEKHFQVSVSVKLK